MLAFSYEGPVTLFGDNFIPYQCCPLFFWLFQKPVDESMVDLIISRCNAFFEPFPEQALPFKIIPRAEESMLMHKDVEDDAAMQNAMDVPDSSNKKMAPKENFKSKNLHSERKRRERINQRIYALRAVVPNVTKVFFFLKKKTHFQVFLLIWDRFFVLICR